MQKQQLISSIFDFLIPFLLYFIWDWDLHFILLFTYIDALAGIVVSYFKERKIESYKQISKSTAVQNLLKYLIFGVLGIVFFELAVQQIYPEMHLWKSFIEFLLFEEFGIPQFAFFLPIIVLLNTQQYKLLFIKNNMHQALPLVFLQQKNRNTWMIFALSGLFIFGFSALISATPLLYLLLIVALKSATDLWLIPYLDQQFVKQFVNSQNDFTR